MTRLVFVIASVCLFNLPVSSWAGVISGGRGLLFPVSARALGMAEAQVAAGDDVFAPHFNPAGLNLLTDNQLGVTYLQGIDDIFYTYLGAGFPVEKAGAWGLGLAYLDGGNLSADNADGTRQNLKAQQDYIFTLSGALRIYGKNLMGLSVKVINSQLAREYRALGYAVDAGVLYPLTDNLRCGAAVVNLGPRLKYIFQGDPMPTQLSFGLAYLGRMHPDHEITLALDAIKPLDQEFKLRAGLEYKAYDIFSLRAGYAYGFDLAGLTAGGGLDLDFISLDYAAAFISGQGLKHHISLGLRF